MTICACTHLTSDHREGLYECSICDCQSTIPAAPVVPEPETVVETPPVAPKKPKVKAKVMLPSVRKAQKKR